MKPLTFILSALVIFNTAVPIASEDTANPNDFVTENIDLYTSILPGDRSPDVNRCILAAIYPPIFKTENEQYDCKTSSEILPVFDGEKVFDFLDYFPITCDKGTTCADISKSALRLIQSSETQNNGNVYEYLFRICNQRLWTLDYGIP